jgi:uncharacterized membrane protein YbhN (UPF0104 family)
VHTPSTPARTHWLRTAKVIAIIAVALGSVGLLLLVAPPSEVARQLGSMRWEWIAIAVGLELASCCSYPMTFRRFFPEPPAAVTRRVAWISMGAGALLPGGDISSAAATGLLLRRHGIGTVRLATRCVALMTLLILFGFFVNGIVAVWLLAHLPGGPHDLLHAGGPLLVSIVVLGSAAGLMVWIRRRGDRASTPVRIAGAGIAGAWDAARRPGLMLLGAAGFLLFDIGALWAAAMATGHEIGLPALMLAYFIGYLATMIPVPAGIGVLDTGLAGCLVLYGMNPAASVGAVLVYHAISVWVPSSGGLIAWLRVNKQLAPTASSQLAGAGTSGQPSAVAAASASAA